MNTGLSLALFFLLLLVGYTQAERKTAPPAQWHHLDPTTEKVIGISTERAYELLKALPVPSRKVIVAVIDGGIDVSHEDLKTVLWTNTEEMAGNGNDDDHNSYPDDVHGWNFPGSKDGRNVEHEQKEETRLYARLKPRYDGKSNSALTPAQQQAYALWQQVKPYFEQKRAGAEKEYQEDSQLLAADKANLETLKKAFGVARLDSALLHYPPTTDTTLLKLSRQYYHPLKGGSFPTTDSLVTLLDRFNADRKGCSTTITTSLPMSGHLSATIPITRRNRSLSSQRCRIIRWY